MAREIMKLADQLRTQFCAQNAPFVENSLCPVYLPGKFFLMLQMPLPQKTFPTYPGSYPILSPHY